MERLTTATSEIKKEKKKRNTFDANEQIHWTVTMGAREWNEYVQFSTTTETMRCSLYVRDRWLRVFFSPLWCHFGRFAFPSLFTFVVCCCCCCSHSYAIRKNSTKCTPIHAHTRIVHFVPPFRSKCGQISHCHEWVWKRQFYVLLLYVCKCVYECMRWLHLQQW